VDIDIYIKELEDKRQKYLLAEEETWRQKSRAIWLQQGDQIQFFFTIMLVTEKKNAIWEMKDDIGISHSGQEDIETEVVRHFKSFYVDSGKNTIVDQVNAVQYYPSFFTERDVQELEKPSSVEEIKLVLKSFSKDKSPGPDGWTVEFFLSFFDLIGNDVLEAVEESRRSDRW
jgi:hypothetical protein